MFPGLPTCRVGGVRIELDIDPACQGRIVTKAGKPAGVWLDDSTPRLDHWLSLAAEKYGPLNQPVFVCVAPGQAGRRYRPAPLVVNVFEHYVYGMGVPASAWPPPPAYPAYVVQWRWPGTHGIRPPTPAERQRVLADVEKHNPEYIFLF